VSPVCSCGTWCLPVSLLRALSSLLYPCVGGVGVCGVCGVWGVVVVWLCPCIVCCPDAWLCPCCATMSWFLPVVCLVFGGVIVSLFCCRILLCLSLLFGCCPSALLCPCVPGVLFYTVSTLLVPGGVPSVLACVSYVHCVPVVLFCPCCVILSLMCCVLRAWLRPCCSVTVLLLGSLLCHSVPALFLHCPWCLVVLFPCWLQVMCLPVPAEVLSAFLLIC
jgi:hypothetical protein